MMPRHAAKKDNSHAEIAAEFERLGCTVLDTSAYPGFVDMLVYRHHPRLVEAKTGRRKLRQSQIKLAETWAGPIHVVRSAIEARALVQEWDREEMRYNDMKRDMEYLRDRLDLERTISLRWRMAFIEGRFK